MGIKYNDKPIKKLYYGEQEIVKRIIENEIVYDKSNPLDRRFRFKNVSDKQNILKLNKGHAAAVTPSPYLVKLDKSSNGVDYSPCDIYQGIELQPGETVYLRGNNKTISPDPLDYNNFSSTAEIECHGSIMDLCDGGTDSVVCTVDSQFAKVFFDMKNLLTAPELPAITLTKHCYNGLFENCTSLKQAPELPATTLAASCYAYTFKNCYSLMQAPKLPATNLAASCYMFMFAECHTLTQASNLPATTLTERCYKGMYSDCISLTQAPKLPATNLAEECYRSVLSGCSKLTQAPELPATTLVFGCYDYAFAYCSNLNYVEVNAVQWFTTCAEGWLAEVSTTGTLIKPASLQIGTGEGQIPENSTSGIPTGWKVQDI